ncbi:MAG TPA: hypothetical protein DHV62_04330 [Elusimicrobia bacterium]|jgi:uncharacterized protein (TIGR00159 family)|nr:hypothetical protein [Elusimicrobiota bacterium]
MVGRIIATIREIRLADFVDIGIIAIFIYLALVWLERARARFVFIGIIILGSIYVAARLLGLYLTTMFFQAFFAISLIIIVIIFQDEIRHFLERIGIWGIPRRRRHPVSFNSDVEILSSALVNLSRKRTGALVVIKGRDPLERYLQAGVPVDGLLSQILLESIFDPNAPSHDGAIIVERGRITMLGCYLPLSTNIEEISRLGTRHAAALGITEHTDVLSVVVSEERGTISIAEEGKIKHLSDPAQLKDILEDFYERNFPRKKGITLSGFLRGHSLEKIIAVIFASALWLSFGYRSEIVRRDFVIPIEYRNLSPDWIIAEPKPKETTITLSGSEKIFNLVDPKEFKLSLDMAKVKEGVNEFPLTKDLIRYPGNLSLVKVQPEKIRLKIYKRKEKL